MQTMRTLSVITIAVIFMLLRDYESSVAANSCNTKYPPGLSTDDTLTHDGLTRTFRVFVPPKYDEKNPIPLLFLLHGGFGTGQNAESSYSMNLVASRETFAVVYPDGLYKTWNAKLCCGQAMIQNIDDVGFINAVIDQLSRYLWIDTNRIYSTGMSNGAIMSHRLALELPHRFVAIAPVEGTYFTAEALRLPPGVSIPTLIINGLLDENIPFEGGVGCGVSGVSAFSVSTTAENWMGLNRCSCKSFNTTECASLDLELSRGDGVCMKHNRGCLNGAEVTVCYGPWAHTWGGGQQRQYTGSGCSSVVSETFIVNEVMWDFFQRHRKLGTIVESPCAVDMNPSASQAAGRDPSFARSNSIPGVFVQMLLLAVVISSLFSI